MSYKRYTLAFPDEDVDLRDYEDEIVNGINEVAPGKNPKVYKNYFTTDTLEHGESVRIGRKLSRIDKLYKLGGKVEIFRLFNGMTVDDDIDTGNENENDERPAGGRMK